MNNIACLVPPITSSLTSVIANLLAAVPQLGYLFWVSPVEYIVLQRYRPLFLLLSVSLTSPAHGQSSVAPLKSRSPLKVHCLMSLIVQQALAKSFAVLGQVVR